MNGNHGLRRRNTYREGGDFNLSIDLDNGEPPETTYTKTCSEQLTYSHTSTKRVLCIFPEGNSGSELCFIEPKPSFSIALDVCGEHVPNKLIGQSKDLHL